jgi:hypothetical protein
VKARLVLEPESAAEAFEMGHVVVAEVVQVSMQLGEDSEIPCDVLYLESASNVGAERKLERPPVGWPIIVYVRREGDGETASPGG